MLWFWRSIFATFRVTHQWYLASKWLHDTDGNAQKYHSQIWIVFHIVWAVQFFTCVLVFSVLWFCSKILKLVVYTRFCSEFLKLVSTRSLHVQKVCAAYRRYYQTSVDYSQLKTEGEWCVYIADQPQPPDCLHLPPPYCGAPTRWHCMMLSCYAQTIIMIR